MLEELTNDIHQSPNKQKVLMELANCIASGEDILLISVIVWLTLVFFDTRVQTAVCLFPFTYHRR